MKPIDTTAGPAATARPVAHRDDADGGRGRQFARCVTAAERRAAAEPSTAGRASADGPVCPETDALAAELDPRVAAATVVAAQGAFAQVGPTDSAARRPDACADAGLVRVEGGAAADPPSGTGGPADPRAGDGARPPVRQAEPGPVAARKRSGEAGGGEESAAVSPEPGRSQTGVASAEAPAPSRGPDGDAARLARSMLGALPDAGAADRTLTVSFPATAGGAVERMVLTVSGGVIGVVVTARAQHRERVAAALPELARLMRGRGLRLGAIGLG